MIYLITAVPGSGKTLFAIDYFLKSGNFQGRPIYCNINGLNWPDVLPAPDDWRDTPVGSLVIYDEAQQTHLFPATGRPGRSSDERLIGMETHRHTGHDLVFITQSPTQIHHQIRNLCGRHFHLYRAARLKKAMIYEHDSVMDIRNLGRYPSRLWSFPEDIFNSYVSTTNDTHSGFKLPGRVVFIFAFILVGILFVSYMGYRAFLGFSTVSSVSAIAKDSNSQPTSSKTPDSHSAAAASPSVPVQWDKINSSPSVIGVPPDITRAIESLPPPTGCIASKTVCRCYGDSGVELLIPQDVCRDQIARVMPIRVRSANNKGDADLSDNPSHSVDISGSVREKLNSSPPSNSTPSAPSAPSVASSSVSMGYGYPASNPGGLGFSQ